MASPPFSLISRATAWPRSTPRAARTTLAPSLANACAAARPIPEFPPVTKATLFANFCTVSPPFFGRKRNLHPESSSLLTCVKKGQQARSRDRGNRLSRWCSRFGRVHPPFFLYLFILKNFKSFNFATADCKALSDRNLTSAHSKGLADFNGRQTAASPSAAPI